MGNLFNISYTKKFPFIKVSKKDLFSIFLIAMIFGFLSFIYETLLDLINMNTIYDRGFLTGPFLPIYFFVTFFGLLFFKTPEYSVKGIISCMLTIGIGITIVEFLIGNLFELLFSVSLWDYEGFMPLSFKYISLVVSVSWALLGTIVVMFIIPLLKRKIDRINEKYHKVITIILLSLFVIDIIVTAILIIINKGYKQLYELETNTFVTLIVLLLVLLLMVIVFLLLLEPKKYIAEDKSIYNSKYPVVLVHGMMLKNFKLYNAFRKIKDVLKDNGVKVYVSNIDGIATIKNNAMYLKQEILEIIKIENVDKVNIIAHSKGGLDSRYMISMLDMEDYVASLTTLSTPHHGSKMSRKLLTMPKWLAKIIALFVNMFYKICKDKKPDILSLAYELTDESMKKFNEEVKNSDKVYYQSYSSSLNKNKQFIMYLPLVFSSYCEQEETDGIVSVSSSMWGDYQGKMNENFNHANMVGAYGSYNSLLEVSKFYLSIVANLKEKGM